MNLKRIHDFSLCIYIFSICFESWDPFNFNIDYLFTKFTICLYLAISTLRFKIFIDFKKFKKFTIPLILIFSIQFISGYFNQNNEANYFSLITFLNFIVFFTMLAHTKNDKNLLSRASNYFLTSLLFILVFIFFKIETDYNLDGRLTIFGVNQNWLALNFSIAIILLANKLLQLKGKFNATKVIFLLMIISLFFQLSYTGSRSGFIGMILGLFFLFFRFKFKYLIQSILNNIKILTFIAIIIFIIFLDSELFSSRFNAFLSTGDLSGRDLTWTLLLENIDAIPLFGIGYSGYFTLSESLFGYYSSAHNFFLETLFIGGFPSLILLIIFIVRIFLKAIKNKSLYKDYLSIALILPVLVDFISGQPFGNKIIFFVFAFIINFNLNLKKNNN